MISLGDETGHQEGVPGRALAFRGDRNGRAQADAPLEQPAQQGAGEAVEEQAEEAVAKRPDGSEPGLMKSSKTIITAKTMLPPPMPRVIRTPSQRPNRPRLPTRSIKSSFQSIGRSRTGGAFLRLPVFASVTPRPKGSSAQPPDRECETGQAEESPESAVAEGGGPVTVPDQSIRAR